MRNLLVTSRLAGGLFFLLGVLPVVMGATEGETSGAALRVRTAVEALDRGELRAVDSLMKPLSYEQVTALSGRWAAYGLKMLGVAAYYQESFKLSNAYYSLLLAHPYSRKDPELRADCHNNRGINYEIMGVLDSAYLNYQRSLVFERQEGDSVGLAQSWVNLGLLAGKLGYFEQALSYGEKAVAFFQKAGKSSMLALATRNLGLAKMWQGQYEGSIAYFRRARRLHQEMGDSLGIYQVETNMVNALLEAKRPAEAGRILGSAPARFEAQGDRKATLVRNLARLDLSLAQEAYGRARRVLENQLLPQLEKIKQLGLYEQYLMLRMQLSGAEGRHQKMRAWSDALTAYQRRQRREQTRVIWREQALQSALVKKQVPAARPSPPGSHFYGIPLNWWGPIIFSLVVIGIVVRRYVAWPAWHRRKKSTARAVGGVVSKSSPKKSEEGYTAVLFERLERHMAQEERFRDPECNLSLVAKELSTNVSYLSRAVNQGSGTNFRGYLNKWRIETAKKELVNLEGSQTVAEVGYNVGYKSPSVFTRVFKDSVGRPPKAFSRPLAD